MDETLSRVYIRVDGRGCITRCEGQYTLPDDLSGWTRIEEGPPCDRRNLAQTHYFDGGLYTADGLCRWKYADGAAALRTEAELAADRAEIPEPEPSAEEDRDAMIVDHELRLTMLELGITE